MQSGKHFGYQKGNDQADCADLELVGVLRHGEAWEGLACAFPFYLNPKNSSGFPASGPEHREGGEGFAIKACNEERLIAARPFPHLTDLNLGNRHFGRVSN